jgi:hypothetical protein
MYFVPFLPSTLPGTSLVVLGALYRCLSQAAFVFHRFEKSAVAVVKGERCKRSYARTTPR